MSNVYRLKKNSANSYFSDALNKSLHGDFHIGGLAEAAKKAGYEKKHHAFWQSLISDVSKGVGVPKKKITPKFTVSDEMTSAWDKFTDKYIGHSHQMDAYSKASSQQMMQASEQQLAKILSDMNLLEAAGLVAKLKKEKTAQTDTKRKPVVKIAPAVPATRRLILPK